MIIKDKVKKYVKLVLPKKLYNEENFVRVYKMVMKIAVENYIGDDEQIKRIAVEKAYEHICDKYFS